MTTLDDHSRRRQSTSGKINHDDDDDNNNHRDVGRPRFAHWMPWERCGEEFHLRSRWFKYAQRIHQVFQPGFFKWPFEPLPVFNWDQVDESIREPGIYGGYRPEVSSWTECCHSLFTANNETLNFWTHFFPTVFFVYRTVQLADTWRHDSYTQSFLVYMVTAILYPLMSAMAHGFSSLSHRARAIGFFMDYAAISFYAFGSGLLYRAYVLPEQWMDGHSTDLYLSGCAVLSLASTLATCISRAFVRDILVQRLMRLAAFTLPYIWVSVPLFARLLYCWFPAGQSTCPTQEALDASKLHLSQVVVALLASFCYASHLPERILPGKFDYVGHSHNLLHICGVAATVLQMEGALIDLQFRKAHLTANHLTLAGSVWNSWVPVGVCLGHVLLVVGFGRYICCTEAIDDKPKRN